MKKLTKKHLLYAVCAVVVVAILASFTALIAVPSVKRTAIKIAKNDLFENYYSFPEGGLVTTANGFAGNNKNSLLYVKAAFQNDADCVEVDLCFNENGDPYICENADKIDNTTMPFEYLISFVSEEINSSSQRNRSINIHLEDASGIKEVSEIISRYKMEEHCFFTGVSINQAAFIRNNTTIPFYLDYEIDKSKAKNADYASLVASEISASGAIGINCKADCFSEIFTNIFKENWLKISFYGAENEFDIINALKFSPNQIITSDPQLARSILIEWHANAPSSDIIYS